MQRTAGRCMKIEATRQKKQTDINDACILTGVKHSNIIVFYLRVFAIYIQKKEKLKTTSTQIFFRIILQIILLNIRVLLWCP